MSNDDVKKINRVDFKGHVIWPGANRITSGPVGDHFHYRVVLQFQERAGVVGYSDYTGLIRPADGAQTGEWRENLIEYLKSCAPARSFPLMIDINRMQVFRWSSASQTLQDDEVGSWDNEG